MTDEQLENLSAMYGERNILAELDWCAHHLESGYLNKHDAKFICWLVYAAYKRIKELEGQNGN